MCHATEDKWKVFDIRPVPGSAVRVSSVLLALSRSRKWRRVVSFCLWRQLLQKLYVELDTTDKRCIFFSSQQLGVHVLIGFQQLLVLIARKKNK